MLRKQISTYKKTGKYIPLKLDKLLFGGSQMILALNWLRAVSSSPNILVASSHCLDLRLVSLKKEKKIDSNLKSELGSFLKHVYVLALF